jgi:hypothetical protein
VRMFSLVSHDLTKLNEEFKPLNPLITLFSGFASKSIFSLLALETKWIRKLFGTRTIRINTIQINFVNILIVDEVKNVILLLRVDFFILCLPYFSRWKLQFKGLNQHVWFRTSSITFQSLLLVSFWECQTSS